MPSVGSMDSFDPDNESIHAYLERLDQYFFANDIGQYVGDDANLTAAADKKKVASLIAIMGKRTYTVLQDLCKPDLPADKVFRDLRTLLNDHYQPKKIEVAETFKFHRCFQTDKETVVEFSARLRGMAANCNFGAFLNRSL